MIGNIFIILHNSINIEPLKSRSHRIRRLAMLLPASGSSSLGVMESSIFIAVIDYLGRTHPNYRPDEVSNVAMKSVQARSDPDLQV